MSKSPPAPPQEPPTGGVLEASPPGDAGAMPRGGDAPAVPARDAGFPAGPRERAWAAGLLAAAVILRLIGVWQIRFNSDEPQHAHVVWGWSRGLVQYRDLFDNHTPLFHMLWAPLLAAFGESVRTLFWLRLTMLPLYLAALAVTYAIGRRLLSARTALWGTVLTALLPPFFTKTLEFRTDVPWTLLWMGAFQVLTGGPPGPARLFAAGLLVGTAAAVSLKSSLLLACLLGSAAVTLAWRWRTGGVGAGRALPAPGANVRMLAAFGAAVAGVATVPLAVVLYFKWRGALDALLAGAVLHNLQVSQHGPGPLKRALVLAVGAPLLFLIARWSLRAGPPALAAQRLLLALTTGSYLIALEAFWPLITSQTYLPVEPLLCLLVAAAALPAGAGPRQPAAPRPARPASPWRLTPGRAFLALALAVELCIDVLHGPVRGDHTAPATAIVAAALRLTGPDEAVFDDKGDAVFRRRAFYPVLEDITREAMARGRIADTVPEAILASHACLATLDSRRLAPRGKAFLNANFLPVGPVRVCGRWLPLPPAAAPLHFQVEIPARYVIVGRGGPARGRLDGTELSGPRDLAAGSHVFVFAPDAPPRPPYALLWARAAAAGYSPFPPFTPGPP